MTLEERIEALPPESDTRATLAVLRSARDDARALIDQIDAWERRGAPVDSAPFWIGVTAGVASRIGERAERFWQRTALFKERAP